MKTIIEFDEEEQKKVNIQNVALDVFRRRIYWTDPTMTEGEGRIESANLDGTDRKVILKKLHWPQGMGCLMVFTWYFPSKLQRNIECIGVSRLVYPV